MEAKTEKAVQVLPEKEPTIALDLAASLLKKHDGLEHHREAVLLLERLLKVTDDYHIRKRCWECLVRCYSDFLLEEELSKRDRPWYRLGNYPRGYDAELGRRIASLLEDADQEVLYSWARGGKYPFDSVATRFVTDQWRLEGLALYNNSKRCRLEAVKRLEDLKVVEWVAMFDEDTEVRVAAIQRVTDQKVLTRIALCAGPFPARLAAVKKLNDTEVLARIAKTDGIDDVRSGARARLSQLNERE